MTPNKATWENISVGLDPSPSLWRKQNWRIYICYVVYVLCLQNSNRADGTSTAALTGVGKFTRYHSKKGGSLRVRKCPVVKTLVIEPSERVPRTQRTFKSSKFLLREPNEVHRGVHITFKGSSEEKEKPFRTLFSESVRVKWLSCWFLYILVVEQCSDIIMRIMIKNDWKYSWQTIFVHFTFRCKMNHSLHGLTWSKRDTQCCV